MRRPTRTRRLSIAAISSLLAFAVVASAVARSFWTFDEWDFGNRMGRLGLRDGFVYRGVTLSMAGKPTRINHPVHVSGELRPYDREQDQQSICFLIIASYPGQWRMISMPLWLPLFLLLIAPVRWLVARRATAPAFPVFAKA